LGPASPLKSDKMSDEKKASAACDLKLERADPGLNHLQDVNLGDKALNNDAFEAKAQEHGMGFVQAMKTYKRVAFWSARECP
jgi:MFS transporter, SP family, general alpha glucoside:H+ symporter